MPGARAALARASRALRLNAACCDSACRVKPELSLSLSLCVMQCVRASAFSPSVREAPRGMCTAPLCSPFQIMCII